MQTGLFFGSFNPIHVGHLILANYIVEYTGNKEVWFVVSPHNPLKEKKSLLDDYQRRYMVELAINGYPKFSVCDIEFRMPQPSYTIDTLTRLSEKYPKRQFSIIMGSDGLPTFYKWKNHELLAQKYRRVIYPRPGIKKSEITNHQNIELVDAPQIDVSSSFIRKAISNGKDPRFFLPPKVYEYIEEMNFYR